MLNEPQSRLPGKALAKLIMSAAIIAIFAYGGTSYAQSMMGGNMKHMQNMQQMNNMQNKGSMSDMMEHMHVMTNELSGMMKNMKSMKGMEGMSAEGGAASGGEGMDQQMSMMQQMHKLGTNMESMLEQMDKIMSDKTMMSDPKMKHQMMQMQMHMGSLVNDYHEMMQNLKKENGKK